MKLTVLKPTEVEASFIQINVPVRYGTEDIPEDFPFRRPWRKGDTGDESPSRRHDRWDVTVAIDNGQIQGWPAGVSAELDMKVTDEGTYILLDHAGEALADIYENYVPECVPGRYGDYVEMTIGPDGTIKEWADACRPSAVRTEFFPRDDDA